MRYISARRVGLILTVCVHGLLLQLVIAQSQHSRLVSRGGYLIIKNVSTKLVIEKNTKLPLVSGRRKKSVTSHLASTESQSELRDTVSRWNDNEQNRVTAIDPFASPAIAEITSSPTMVQAVMPTSTLRVITELLRKVVQDRVMHLCGPVSASFAMTVLGDGSIVDVRFISGSIEPEQGMRLAHALEAKVVFEPSISGPTRRTMLGPIELDPAEFSVDKSAIAGTRQC